MAKLNLSILESFCFDLSGFSRPETEGVVYHETMFRDKVFLASQSPRRRELVSHLFENIEIFNISFDEPQDSRGEPKEFLSRCVGGKWAQAKAKMMQGGIDVGGQAFLLVADTLVAFSGRLLGKPRDDADAVRMLKSLSGRWHEVHTGFCLNRWDSAADIETVTTRVRFRKLSARDIAAYVATGEPRDKAGAYGFQEKGVGLIDRIEGPYTNVIGLPVEALRRTALARGLRST